VRLRWRGGGKASLLRDGKVEAIRDYWSRDAAMEAAVPGGLSASYQLTSRWVRPSGSRSKASSQWGQPQKYSVVPSRFADGDVEWLLTEAGRTDHDVEAAVQEEVGIDEKPVKAAPTAEVQLTSGVLVVRRGSAADAEPYQRAAAGGTDH
jgi:hypothetical protein